MVSLFGVGGVHVEAHPGAAEILRVELARAVQTALLAHGEQQGERRMRQPVLQQRLDHRDDHRAPRARIAAERGAAVGHDPVALAHRV